jgi:hypothetical protein
VLTRRSITGYIVFAAGEPISWHSKLQPIVATSNQESKYMALNAGIQKLVWLRGMMTELKCKITVVDSQSAKYLAENPVFNKIREYVNPGGL